ILLGPSTLLAALKLVHHMWRQEEQNKNAQEIASQGAALYDKFVGFLEDMQKIKESLDTAHKAYGNAWSKLKEGKGNLIRQVERLRELGVQPKKQLPEAGGDE
ncbi:MAG: DNA recombination protein RmuC, partial [Leptospiraceae bacterium]|nr:DNA recombination protein RmuC [Leptospiraceae bacterium]